MESYSKSYAPQISFVIGPTISGKETLAQALADRSNAKLLNFNTFCKDSGLDVEDDDTLVLALIQHLAEEISPRVIITDFPKTEY